MLAATDTDRILDALRRSSHPLDDDQLAERTAIQPWQLINSTCRALERSGRIRRMVGPDQKVVNALVLPALALSTAEMPIVGAVLNRPERVLPGRVVSAPVPVSAHPGDRELPPGERVLLDRLSERLGLSLTPARITLPSGTPVEIDGADDSRSVLVECWAHRGRPDLAKQHEVLTSVLKLNWIAATIQPRPRMVLCLGDQAAAEPFLPTTGSWAAQALRDMGITVTVV
jgi:hypothetical protein